MAKREFWTVKVTLQHSRDCITERFGRFEGGRESICIQAHNLERQSTESAHALRVVLEVNGSRCEGGPKKLSCSAGGRTLGTC